jgi:hypothetical protein
MGQAAHHRGPKITGGTEQRRLDEAHAEAVGAGRSSFDGRWSTPASSREAVMTTRSFVALVIISAIWTTASVAGEAEPVRGVVPASAATAESDQVRPEEQHALEVNPWVHPSMPENVQAKLAVAFQMAVERVQEVEECGAMFAELGVDGVETLSNALYFPADPYKETTRCSGAAAYTYVGDRPTRLCCRFTTLSDEWAATIVVHEALHGAGLTEKPHDPKAKSSGAINKMVRRACGF